MGVGTIKMDKISDNVTSAFYKASTNDYESKDFYVLIDKKNGWIKFYLTPDAYDCVLALDINKD